MGLQLKKIGQIPASLGGSVASQKEKPYPCPPPYPPPFPPPYPPAVHVPGWPPMGMHSSPHWIPPVPACPPWPKAPPGHRSPASGYSPFDVGRDAYKVNNSNIQGPSHRQQT